MTSHLPPPSRNLTIAQIEEIAETLLDSLAQSFPDSDDQITSIMAETNAAGYGLDQVEIASVGPLDVDTDKAALAFKGTAYFSGEQDTEKMFYGDSIIARVSGEISYDGARWVVSDYSVHAELDYPQDAPDDQ